jgi:hypothetical protein
MGWAMITSPWRGPSDLAGHGAGRPPARLSRPGSRSLSGLRTGSGPKGKQGGAGAKQPEVEDG